MSTGTEFPNDLLLGDFVSFLRRSVVPSQGLRPADAQAGQRMADDRFIADLLADGL